MRTKKNQLRVISGIWKGRKFNFTDQIDSLRPTPDRVKETLFNWLSNFIRDANCLDLFAGSGALSFESLSRGAAKVTAIDKDKFACEIIKENYNIFIESSKAGGLVVRQQDVKEFLLSDQQKYDIIFIDPPYSLDLTLEISEIITNTGKLNPQGILYLERNTPLEEDMHLPGLEVFRHSKAGGVYYYLLQREDG